MPAYRLTASFPYLVRRVGVRIGELFDLRVAEFGVSVSMFRVLAALTEEDGQRLGRLAEMTSIEMSTLSRLVGSMMRKGLVWRRRSSDNARTVEIGLTARGRELAGKLTPIAAHYDAVALAGLDQRQIAELKTGLVTAFANLDRLERELAAPSSDAGEKQGRRTVRAPAKADTIRVVQRDRRLRQ